MTSVKGNQKLSTARMPDVSQRTWESFHLISKHSFSSNLELFCVKNIQLRNNLQGHFVQLPTYAYVRSVFWNTMVPAFLGCIKKYRRDILHTVKTDMVIIEAVSEIEMTVSFQVRGKENRCR
jgi:hypothetical protein